MDKLEELRRRRGITGLLGCPSDTKDPDDWDWDNWDNWPQEDKDMFPLEDDKNTESLNESVLFVDKWQDTLELLPDCDNVWFIADGKIYIGLYEPEQDMFCMADGLGVPRSNVRQWKYITDKEIARYPKEKQIIAVDVPEFPCPVTGIFSDHLVDEETGDEFSGVLLDDEYAFCEEGYDSISWDNVFAWYPVPDAPLKVIDVNKELDLSVEFDEPEDTPVEEVAEDIGPEPLPEVGPEPLPEVEPTSEPVAEPAEVAEAPAEAEGDIFDTMEGVKRDASPEAVEKTAEQDIFTTMDVSGNNMNSIEDALEDSKEEPLVKESQELKGERLTESEDSALDEKVKDWYVKEYPTDDMGEDIDPEVSFMDVFHALDNYEDIYDVLGVGDSIIRERVFTELADRMDVDYDYIFDQWLKAADEIDKRYQQEYAKKQHEYADNAKETAEYLKKLGLGIYEAVDKKNPHVREAKVYYDFPGDYHPWSGAVDTWNIIEENDAIDGLEQLLDEQYPDGIGETELNDLLWFDSDFVFDYLGIKNPYDEDEEEEEEEEDEEEELIPVSEEEYKGYDICEWYEDDEDPDPEKTYFTICVGNRSVGGVLPSKDAAKKKIDDGNLKESKIREKFHRIEHEGNVFGYCEPGEDEYLFYSNGKSSTRPIGFISVDDGKVYLKGHLAKEVYEAFPDYIELRKQEKKVSKIKKFKESIRGNTKQFVKNVEEYINGWGEEKWDNIKENVQYLQEYARYGTLNEAIREYIEGGCLDCYYDEVRKTLNELYENTPEEVKKWADYPTDKLWERYINVMCLYLPKAYKLHTGKELDMRKDPDSEYNQKVKAKYGERKLSVGEYLYERGLTRAERQNRALDKVFDNHRRIINSQKDFLKAKGVSDEELEELDHGTGLSHDAIGDKIRDMGCWDEYWNTGKKVCEHLEHISDEAYGKWVKLKRKLDHDYLADYCLEALPPYEAELVINYLADMNGIENGDLNQY